MPDDTRKWLEGLSVSQSAQRHILWAALAAASSLLAVRWFRGSRSQPQPQPSSQTDFNSFLVDVTKPPQGTQKQKLQPNLQQPAAASFDAFLKERKPALVATEFDAFLKDQEVSELHEEESPAAAPDSNPKEDQVVVTVLFGTEYGFAQEISGKLCEMLQELGKYWPRLLNMADFPDGTDLTQEQVLLAICSTQGDGVPPSEARGFCDWLNSSAARKLPGMNYSVCALGDTSYNYFCACGKQIDARLASLEARQFVPRRDVNKEDWGAIDSWLRLVIDSLDLLKLQTVAESGYEVGSGGTEKPAAFSKARPLMAKICAVEGLCQIREAADKDTIRVEVDLGESGLEYFPGDALGIYASNDPQVVDELLQFTGSEGNELYKLPAWHYADVARPAGSQISLREMLMHCYDLRSPKAALLQLLSDHLPPQTAPKHTSAAKPTQNGQISNGSLPPSNGLNGHLEKSPKHLVNGKRHQEGSASSARQQAQRLKQLLEGREDEREKYFEPRHVVDVLQDFSDSKPPLSKLLGSLRALQPRLYSISSSPLENACRIQITVATVRYSSLQKERLGVASTYLAERIQVGEKLPVYIFRNPDFRLPEDPSKPIIMVGPGTGLAPFRAFILERSLSGQQCGPSMLFFGCRRRDQDYLYGEDLESWAAEGRIELVTAFSREQGHKVYVQDRLREHGQRVWQLLQLGGHFYVCGDAAYMASAVEAALLDVISSHQGAGKEAAGKYLEALQQQQRYQRDVWF